MTRLTLLLLLFAAFTGSKSQELGTEENPFPAEDDEPEEVPGSSWARSYRKFLEDLHDHVDGNKDGKVSLRDLLEFSTKAGLFLTNHEIESTRNRSLSLEEHIKDIAEDHEGLASEEKAKVLEYETAMFQASDINGDGQLDAGELVYLRNPGFLPEVLDLFVAEQIRKKDKNGDGKLAEDEFPPEWDEDLLPYPMDANRDDVIDEEELKQFVRGDLYHETVLGDMVRDADTDGDGYVSKKEMGNFENWLEDYSKLYVNGFESYLNLAKVTTKEEV
jgi:Ca2+-binding EF-hand superfamily protein